MKQIAFVTALLMAMPFAAKAQQTGAKPTKAYSQSQANNMVNTLLHDTCLDKKFSVVFYLIQDSAFKLTSNPATHTSYSITYIMNTLNNIFRPICVSFEHCKTVIIPNYSYHRWKEKPSGQQVLKNYYTENTINIYLPDKIEAPYPDIMDHSYCYAPGVVSFSDAIVISMERIKSSVTRSELPHVFGHYFGLPHTFSEKNPGTPTTPPAPSGITSFEFADRSDQQNCFDHGDGFCDTEADPWPNSNVPPGAFVECQSAGTLQDAKGTMYVVPVDNYMSFYACRCKFSQQQMNYMARWIVKNRMYLH